MLEKEDSSLTHSTRERQSRGGAGDAGRVEAGRERRSSKKTGSMVGDFERESIERRHFLARGCLEEARGCCLSFARREGEGFGHATEEARDVVAEVLRFLAGGWATTRGRGSRGCLATAGTGRFVGTRRSTVRTAYCLIGMGFWPGLRVKKGLLTSTAAGGVADDDGEGRGGALIGVESVVVIVDMGATVSEGSKVKVWCLVY